MKTKLRYKTVLFLIFIIFYFLPFGESAVGGGWGCLYADWVQVNNGLTDLHVNSLIANGNYLFAGTEYCSNCGGIFISTNNGNNWAIVPQLEYAGFISMAKNSLYTYAVGSDLVFSSNNGANWVSYTYMPNGSHTYHQVATNENNIFVGLHYFSNDPGGIYRSTDNGFNWAQTSFPTGQYQNVVSIAINNNYIFASSGLLFGTQRSSDSGITWNQCLNTASLPIAVKGDSVYLFGGPYPGYFYYSSNNGNNWVQTQDSLVARALLVYGNYLFAGGGISGGSFFISNNNGITWLNRSEGMLYFVFSLCISNNYIYAGTDGYGVFRRPLGEITQINVLSPAGSSA